MRKKMLSFQVPNPSAKNYNKLRDIFEKETVQAFKELDSVHRWSIFEMSDGAYKIKGARPEDTRMAFPDEWIIIWEDNPVGRLSIYTDAMYRGKPDSVKK